MLADAFTTVDIIPETIRLSTTEQNCALVKMSRLGLTAVEVLEKLKYGWEKNVPFVRVEAKTEEGEVLDQDMKVFLLD